VKIQKTNYVNKNFRP